MLRHPSNKDQRAVLTGTNEPLKPTLAQPHLRSITQTLLEHPEGQRPARGVTAAPAAFIIPRPACSKRRGMLTLFGAKGHLVRRRLQHAGRGMHVHACGGNNRHTKSTVSR